MPSPQKQKGSSWERDVAKFLTSTYKESFIRAPGSGAYVGGSNQVRKQFLHEGQIRSFKGDIVPGESFKRFNAECKNYGDFPFHQLLQGECKQLDSWINQLMDVADPDDVNILFIKISRIGKFILVQDKYTWDHSIPHTIYFNKTYGTWKMFDFDSFWEYNTNIFKTLCTHS
jgi:hypothetical protein